MPSRNPALRFEDILENISRIERYTTVNFTRIMLVAEKDLAALNDSCREALRRIDRDRGQ